MRTPYVKGTQDRKRLGAAAVEFAMVLPVFLVLIFGMIDFGRAMMMSQVVQNASREGARLAATDGATNAGVETRINDYLNGALGIGASQINITVTAGPGNPDPTNVADATAGDQCTVQVLVPYNEIAVFKVNYFSNANLRGYASMRREW